MKANEAPEKIYVPTAGDELHYHMTCPNNDFKESIEYTRTDAFIEKAVDWLEDNAIDYWGTDAVDNGMMIEDFKKAMKL